MEKYQYILPHIMKWEGGLSNDTADSASKNPCPKPYKEIGGYHTNRGVTWTTFQSYCREFGLNPLDETDKFFEMTKEQAGKIFKKLYWDRVKADYCNSIPIANCLAQWCWGSGSVGAWNLVLKYLNKLNKTASKWGEAIDIINDRCETVGARQVFKELCDIREQFFKDIAKPDSKNAKFLKGWLNRLDSFKKFNEPLFDINL